MPIIIQHQPSPAAVGVAAFVSGAGTATERRRKEQLALLERNRDRYFQVGMQERMIGARADAQEAGFRHDIAQQGALFGQQRELAEDAFKQRGLLQDQELAQRGLLQENVFANQQALQERDAADRERLWGMREEQDFIAAAREDIRTGKSVLGLDSKKMDDDLARKRNATTADLIMPEEERRKKLAEFRHQEARILSTAQPPTAPEPPGLDSMLWPGGKVGQGTGLQWDPRGKKYEAIKIDDPVQNAQQKEIETTRTQLFNLEKQLAAKRDSLAGATGTDGKPLAPEQIAAQVQNQVQMIRALRQKLAASTGAQAPMQPGAGESPSGAAAQPPAAAAATPTMSPDGKYVWNGSTWVPKE
jgi:hypothetical protein